MVFKAVFFATVVMVLGAAALVGGRFFGLIDPAPAATSSVCDALSSAQRKALVGEKTPYAEELPASDGVRSGCRWTLEEGDDNTLVEVTSMDADAWVVEFAREAADGSSGDAAKQAVRLRALELGTSASDREACALATKVFELDGAARGAQRAVVFEDSRKSSPRLVAQGCADGVFTRVVVAAPGLKTSATLERRATQALEQVESRLS
jgi:hypothetical protein